MSKTAELLNRLQSAGYSRQFLIGCLPEWWNQHAEDSDSAWLQLQLDFAQRLSLDPGSLIDTGSPLSLPDIGRARFKHLKLEDKSKAALIGFSSGLARLIGSAMRDPANSLPDNPKELRALLISADEAPWIGLPQVLQLAYGVGIGVAHLTTFPLRLKGIAAMATSTGTRNLIFTARKPLHSAQTAFFIAHELGHVALGHIQPGESIVDAPRLDATTPRTGDNDREEAAADRYAIELLTGRPELEVHAPERVGTAGELVRLAVEYGQRARVDPGLVVLIFAKTTNRWAMATKALGQIVGHQNPASQINRALRSQIDEEVLSDADLSYLNAVVAV